MTILLMPTLDCNLKCFYCFGRDRFHKKMNEKLNVSRMIETLNRIYRKGEYIHLHGGEPLLADLNTLERLLSEMYRLRGKTSIQTNLTLLKDEHIELFKKYRTSVGVSIDGSPELTLLRGWKPFDSYQVQRYYNLVMENCEKLKDAGINMGFLVVLTKINAGNRKRLAKLMAWLEEVLNEFNTTARLNFMFDEGIAKKYELSEDEAERVYETLFHFNIHLCGKLYPMQDAIKRLRGYTTVCWMQGCDPFNSLTKTILPDGTLTLCDRWIPDRMFPPVKGVNIREQILRNTECRGCRYFNVCHGGCPREGINGDWRHKTRFCRAYYKLFLLAEKLLRMAGIEPCLGSRK